MADGSVLSGIKTDEAVDMNNIPLALIDHVDVLRDGSEPKYGADAIAGVVNVVLKKDFEGVAASGMGGIAGHGDGATENLSATFGHNFNSATNVTFSASQSHSNPIRQSDRSWARDPITAAEAGSDGSVQLTRGESATPGGRAVSTSGIDALVQGGGHYRDFNPGTNSYDFSRRASCRQVRTARRQRCWPTANWPRLSRPLPNCPMPCAVPIPCNRRQR